MQSESRYNVVITGKLIAGFSLAEAKEHLKKLLKLDDSKATTLLSGTDTVIKSGATYELAIKIQNALEQGGVECRIESPRTLPNDIPQKNAVKKNPKPKLDKVEEYVPASSSNEGIVQAFILGSFAAIVRLAWSMTIGLVLFSIGTVLFVIFDILFPESALSYKVLTNTYKWGSCHWFKRLKLETDEYSVEVEKRR